MKSVLRFLSILGLAALASTSRAAQDSPTNERAKATQREFMQQQRRAMSSVAVEIAKEAFGIDLDYSVDSIKAVDQVMEHYHQMLQRGVEIPFQDALFAQFGVYLVVVIEKAYGSGVLEPNDPVEGPGSLPFTWHEKKMFPSDWCRKRVNEGKSQDIWKKFRSYFPGDEKAKND